MMARIRDNTLSVLIALTAVGVLIQISDWAWNYPDRASAKAAQQQRQRDPAEFLEILQTDIADLTQGEPVRVKYSRCVLEPFEGRWRGWLRQTHTPHGVFCIGGNPVFIDYSVGCKEHLMPIEEYLSTTTRCLPPPGEYRLYTKWTIRGLDQEASAVSSPFTISASPAR